MMECSGSQATSAFVNENSEFSDFNFEHGRVSTLLEILISSKMKQFGFSKAISGLVSDLDYLTYIEF
jgi:hypothetical protein